MIPPPFSKWSLSWKHKDGRRKGNISAPISSDVPFPMRMGGGEK